MTVSTTVFFTDWSAANGVNKDWSYDFNIGDETEVQVLVRDGEDDTTIQVFTDNFQLNKIGDGDEGFVVYPLVGAALAAGKQVRIRRIVPLLQTTEIGNEGDFRPQLHERTFDKLVKMLQQVNGSISSSIIVIGNKPGYTMDSAIDEDAVLIYSGGTITSGPAAGDIANAQGYAEAASDSAELAQKWAENPEDTTVDGAGTYSALHYSAKASGWATAAGDAATLSSDWAENPEDVPVVSGPDRFSALHWAGKAEAAKADIDEIITYSRMPVGTVHWYLGTTAPSGSLVLDGSEITDLYPDLKAMIVAIGSPWGTSVGGHPYLPDLITNGEFIRAGGPGGLAIGTMQLDQMQQITGTFADRGGAAPVSPGVGTPSTSGAFSVGASGGDRPTGSSSGGGAALGFNSANSPGARTGSETRPRNIAFLPCIKAFGTVDPEGMADLSELLTAIADRPTAEAGADNTKLMTPQNTRWAIDARAKFVYEYVSAEQAITPGGLLTLAHGFGISPKSSQAVLICKIAEHGYSVGDVIMAPMTTSSTDHNNLGYVVISGATNITVRFGSFGGNIITTLHKGTGNAVQLTNANWRLIVRAWA